MKKENISNNVVIESIESSNSELILLKSEVERLISENKKLQQELNQLKNPKLEKVLLSDETIIAELQLSRLKQKAFAGELTLEEIKKYDLLVKNKKLAEGNPTIIADYKKLPENVSEDELVLIASNLTNEE